MSTTIPSGKDIQRKWFVIDATGKTLGRLATQAASVLAGKLNPLYTPYIDMGDPDGAKSILEEVVAEGNAQQKSEAQELLKHVS